MGFILKYILIIFLTLIILTTALYIWLQMLEPSNNRNWETDQSILPKAYVDDNFVTIENIRNFSYGKNGEFIPSYYNKKFNISKIETIDYFFEPFPLFGIAHPVISFGFENEDYISLSVEIRTVKDQVASFTLGTFNQYEIIYTLVDERDILIARSINTGHPVYLYPLNAKPENIQNTFRNLIKKINTIHDNPEFYNTFLNNCAGNLFTYINDAFPEKKLSGWKIFFPKYSDEYIYREGLIDTPLTFKDLREKSNITNEIKKYKDDYNFSTLIRKSRNSK